MGRAVRLLVLSQDESLFSAGDHVQGDARRRHVRYAQILRERCGSDSEIRIIAYTKRGRGYRRDDPVPGLRLYGTNSRYRLLYVADVVRLLRTVLADGWRPTAVTTQTPWEEGLIGALLARVLGADFLPQLHFDILSEDWLAERRLNCVLQTIGLMVLRRADRLRVVSTPLRDKIARRLQMSPASIAVIPVGVNFQPSALSTEQAKQALDPCLPSHPLILFVGRLVEQKNLPLFLSVAESIVASRPETRFVLVGSGPMEAAVRGMVRQCNLEQKVLLAGPVGHERLPDVYAGADLLLLTSNYEGFGRVVLEAALASVPTIATRCVGPEDIIVDGVTGYLLPRGDRAGLASACLELLDDAVRCKEMGRAARVFAEATYGLDSLAGQLVSHWAG